ncbi:MAG: hypothetical protein ACKPKO_34610, partial [Candidatus Fonsibacter sp.]
MAFLRCVNSLVVDQLYGYDEHELQELGFVLTDDPPICVPESPVDRVGFERRTFVHFCCKKGAILSRPFNNG